MPALRLHWWRQLPPYSSVLSTTCYDCAGATYGASAYGALLRSNILGLIEAPLVSTNYMAERPIESCIVMSNDVLSLHNCRV